LILFCGLFSNAAYIAGFIASEGRNVELKGCGRKLSWPSWGNIYFSWRDRWILPRHWVSDDNWW